MPFCSKCGNYERKGTPRCSKCAEPMYHDERSNARSAFEKFTDTADTTDAYTQSDIENNKAFGVLAYLGVLVLVPLFAAKHSPFARFHTNQGLVLFLIHVLWIAVARSLRWALWFVPWAVGLADAAVTIAYLVFIVIGIINVGKCRAKELPIIGGIRILK